MNFDIVAYFNEQLKDGFQLEDITNTVREGVRALVRVVADHIPGASGAEKVAWVRSELKRCAHELIGNTLGMFLQGLLALARPFLENALTSLADNLIDWFVDNVADPIIKFAYVGEVAAGRIESESFKAALAA